MPINQALTATFSEAMNPATINSTTFTLTRDGREPAYHGVVTYVAAGSVATFTPNANLAPNTTTRPRSPPGQRIWTATRWSSNYVWTFTTAAAPVLVPPTVISTIPAELCHRRAYSIRSSAPHSARP